MKDVKKVESIPWPDIEGIEDNFQFNCSAEAGNFTLHFKWTDGRWNCWATLPDGKIRQAAVYPNVINWSGHSDFGLVFKTDLKEVARDSLFYTEIYLLQWE